MHPLAQREFNVQPRDLIYFLLTGHSTPALKKKGHRFSKHKGNLRRITKIWHENFPKNKKKTISFIGEKDFPESRSTLDYTCPRAGALGQVKTRVSLDSGKSIFLPMKVIAIM